MGQGFAAMDRGTKWHMHKSCIKRGESQRQGWLQKLRSGSDQLPRIQKARNLIYPSRIAGLSIHFNRGFSRFSYFQLIPIIRFKGSISRPIVSNNLLARVFHWLPTILAAGYLNSPVTPRIIPDKANEAERSKSGRQDQVFILFGIQRNLLRLRRKIIHNSSSRFLW